MKNITWSEAYSNFKTMNNEVKVTVEQLKADLRNGYTRYNSGKGYDPEKKNSIMDKYGVSRKAVNTVFRNSELRNKRTITETTPRFILVTEPTTNVVENDSNN